LDEVRRLNANPPLKSGGGRGGVYQNLILLNEAKVMASQIHTGGRVNAPSLGNKKRGRGVGRTEGVLFQHPP